MINKNAIEAIRKIMEDESDISESLRSAIDDLLSSPGLPDVIILFDEGFGAVVDSYGTPLRAALIETVLDMGTRGIVNTGPYTNGPNEYVPSMVPRDEEYDSYFRQVLDHYLANR